MLKEITTSANNHNREGINKALLCGTGNYIQYPVINQDVKEYEKECICIYIYESLCCTTENNTTLKINYTSMGKKSDRAKSE